MSAVESTISNSSTSLVLGSAKLDRGDDHPQLQLFLPTSKPVALKLRYESPEVFRMPPLHLVDPVLLPQTAADHGPCHAKFSNPQFFLQEWQREEEARLAKLEEEKALRKKERRERRNREKERKQAKENEASMKRQQKKNLNWRDRLNVDDVGMARKDSFRSVQSHDDLVERQTRPVSRVPPRAEPVPEHAPVENARPAPPSSSLRPPPPAVSPPSMPAPPTGMPQPPPGVPPPSHSMPAPPPVPGFPSPPSGPPPPSHGMPPPPAPPMAPMGPPPPGMPAPPSMPAPPPMPQAPMHAPAPPAPPLPPPMPAGFVAPPPMPPAPPAMPGGGASSLILSIQTGKTLRKVEPVQKKADPQSDFLNAIRQGKALKKVEQPAAPQKEAASNLGAFGTWSSRDRSLRVCLKSSSLICLFFPMHTRWLGDFRHSCATQVPAKRRV